MARRAGQVPRWRTITGAVHDPAVSLEDKIAIAAALIEEEALRRAAFLICGNNPDQAGAWYIAHGGRFRFTEDGEDLMVQVPVPPFALDEPRCARQDCGLPQAAHARLAHAFRPPPDGS